MRRTSLKVIRSPPARCSATWVQAATQPELRRICILVYTHPAVRSTPCPYWLIASRTPLQGNRQVLPLQSRKRVELQLPHSPNSWTKNQRTAQLQELTP